MSDVETLQRIRSFLNDPSLYNSPQCNMLKDLEFMYSFVKRMQLDLSRSYKEIEMWHYLRKYIKTSHPRDLDLAQMLTTTEARIEEIYR